MLTVVRILLLSLLFLLRTEYSIAQPAERKNTPQDYIAKYKEDAIREMHQYGVPASITLAQGMLESDNGNSALAVYANNHFGIKNGRVQHTIRMMMRRMNVSENIIPLMNRSLIIPAF
jgi:uncharacterized FlgJ-related protein